MTSLASVWKVQGLQDSLQKIEHFFPANVYVLFQVCFCLYTRALAGQACPHQAARMGSLAACGTRSTPQRR